MPEMLTEVVALTAAIYLLLGMFNVVGWILAVEQIPQAMVGSLLALTDNWVVALLIINVLLLIPWILIEPVPLMVILGPILVPVVQAYGIDPVHFGVVSVLNVVIGVITPPVGTNMFITCAIAKCSMGDFTRGLAFPCRPHSAADGDHLCACDHARAATLVHELNEHEGTRTDHDLSRSLRRLPVSLEPDL